MMATGDPVETVRALLADPTNLEHVRGLTTPDVRYVSLNDDNPELHAVMPWSGPGRGAESIVRASRWCGEPGTWWSSRRSRCSPPAGTSVFGHFTYRSTALGRTITTPFAIRAEVRDGRVDFMQFMEDTFGTAASFRSGGTWRFRTFPGGKEVTVGEEA